MPRSVRQRWLTISLLLIVFGLLFWTLQSFHDFRTALRSVEAPAEIVFPTLERLSPTAVPPTPETPNYLRKNYEILTLDNSNGTPTYELITSRLWKPIIIEELAFSPPTGSHP